MQRYQVALHCIPCRAERLHAVTYLGSVFASATCSVCGESVRPRTDTLVAEYVRDFNQHLSGIGARLAERIPLRAS